MFYLDDHNPNSTQIETNHERQQRRVSAAEAKSFAVDNRPPTPFAGLSTYQNGWLIKGFAHAGVEVDERKKELAENLLNIFGDVSHPLSIFLFAFISGVLCSPSAAHRSLTTRFCAGAEGAGGGGRRARDHCTCAAEEHNCKPTAH